MIDFFTIFTKGGIALFCFQNTTSEIFKPSVNALIRSLISNDKFENGKFDYKCFTLQLKLDNEFDLMFVVGYQKILQLSYADKFLSGIQLEFRDKNKNNLHDANRQNVNLIDFQSNFKKALVQLWAKSQQKLPNQMKTFKDSKKSKKTVSFLIKDKGEESADKNPNSTKRNTKPVKKSGRNFKSDSCDLPLLEYSTDKPDDAEDRLQSDKQLVGQMHGRIKDLEVDIEQGNNNEEKRKLKTQSNKSGAIVNIFNGLASKPLTKEAMQPALDKMKEHLISKNVAAEIADKLCDSVAAKLQGRVLNTFDNVSNMVKSILTDSLSHVLASNSNINILRDCMQAKQGGRPYILAFCGVNGVGKTTNLSKICFWLIENSLSVLIAACDTFRAGAVEQLRTHTRHLNALHPPETKTGRTMVQLYEKGYGKDAAKVASEAIRYAKETKIDVVLIDTAGRMQGNEALMRSLAKLIQFTEPDLTLFVGEALVGNEAVNQLVKFNQALEDHSNSTNPRKIDGILLTKFDTIDDKVGAAISMAYVTEKPIVFVGTGQTYVDLKTLNVNAVVNALMN